MSRAERRRQERALRKLNKRKGTESSVPTSLNVQSSMSMSDIRKMKYQAVDDAIMLTFALPAKVLMDHYWKKSYKKKLPEFTEILLDEYKRWQNGDLDILDLKKMLWEEAGIKFETE